MTETSAATRQGWSPDEKLDLLLAMLSVDNPKLVGRNWDVVAAKLVKKYPGKTREAARQQFQKMRNTFLAEFGVEVEVADEGNKGTAKAKATKKGPNKRATPSADAYGAGEGGKQSLPKVKKPRKPKTKMAAEAHGHGNDNVYEKIQSINGHDHEGFEVDETF